jgi:hypothetical protein
VAPKPGHSLFTFLRKRLLSLAMLVSLGFLLLVSLLASSLLTALLDHVSTVAASRPWRASVANVVADAAALGRAVRAALPLRARLPARAGATSCWAAR